MENKITDISELAELLSMSVKEVIDVFQDTMPALLCQKQYIATEHYELIKTEFNKHLDRVIDADEIVKNAIPLNSFNYQNAGVYFLLDEDYSIVYIGQAVNILNRIKKHLEDKVFYFVSYVRCYLEFDLYMTEDANIRHYNPTFNQVIPFSSYSLLKKLIALCEFDGVAITKAEFMELQSRLAVKARTRRTYKQIRIDREKKLKSRSQTSTKRKHSIISKAYWQSIGK